MAKPQSSQVTIYDVAKHAGVSPMTVSRVVNENAYVRSSTKEKVMSSIKALGYSVNFAAQSTRAGTVRLGILYSNPSAHYLNEILVGCLEQTSKIGCQLILERCDGLQSQKQAINRLIEQGVDGVIVPPPLCDSEPTVYQLQKSGIHVLALASATPLNEVSAVRIDDFDAAMTMTKYLIRLGHTRIAFIKGDPQHTPTVVRYFGYCAALKTAGLDVDESLVVEGNFTYQSGVEAAHTLLRRDNRPTAIFASNDDMASAVLGVAHGMQIEIPRDLSVCGFDDTLVATTTWPTITTIHQPINAMGRTAVSTLVENIRDARAGKAPNHEHALMKFSLKVRGSSGPALDQLVIRSIGGGGILPR
jgi:LacI family transcriptional regulator